MKKKITILFITLILIQSFLFCQTDPKMWMNIYKRAESIKEKLEITKNIEEVVTAEYEDVLIQMINDEVLFVINTSKQMEKTYFEEWVLHTVMILRKAGVKKGEIQLQTLYKKMENPRIKGEIIFTIGWIGNKDLLPWVNNEMDLLNDKHRTGQFEYEEELLHYIILSLEAYNDVSSFEPVFYASIPNYSDKIRKLAGDLLKKLTNDPAPYCNEIIDGESDQRIRLEAFRYSINSESSNEKKIETCRITLLLTTDAVLKTEQEDIQTVLRNESTFQLGELKATDLAIIELIEKKWKFDKDTTSRLITIESLQKIGTEDAGNVLVKKLNFFIDKKKAGDKTGFNEKEAKKIMIAIIRAIGKIPGSVGLEELYIVSNSSLFGGPIKNEAKKAIKNKK